MFSKALVGDDDCQWKYLQLIRKYMEQHEVSDSDGYKRMLRVIYPFRQVNTRPGPKDDDTDGISSQKS